MAELLERVSSRELSEWQCYFELEGPVGEQRADWRAGMLASVIANVNRDPDKRPDPFIPAEFMPTFGDDVSTVDQQRALSMAHMLAARLGGTITVGDGDAGTE